jgi:hypothetical protein
MEAYMEEKQKSGNRYKRAIETTLILKKLIQAQEGDLIKYDDLSQACGRNVQKSYFGGGYTYCWTAREIARKEYGFVFRAVKNEGLLCLDSSGKIDFGESVRNGFRKKNRRLQEVYASVNPDELTTKEKQRYHSMLVTTQTIAMFTSGRLQSRMDRLVEAKKPVVDVDKVLDMFR